MQLRAATNEEIENSSYNPSEGQYLRVSKSSFMTFNTCPRQFYWRYIADIPKPPANEAMLRGTRVHSWLEGAYMNDESIDTTEDEDVECVEALEQMENARMEAWGHDEVFEAVVSAEQKYYAFDEENEVVLVGVIDGVLRHPDGSLIIAELKTGEMGDSKLSRTRRELCYYNAILQANGMDEVKHFMYLTPDCTNEKFLTSMINNRNKEVWLGDTMGVTVIEKVNGRSLKAFAKSYNNVIPSMKSREWPIKWNDYYCPTWCEFFAACENEMMGVTAPLEMN